MCRSLGCGGLLMVVAGFATSILAETPNGVPVLQPPLTDSTPIMAVAPPAIGPVRAHVLVDAKAKSVRRQMVRIADMFPGQSLSFLWSPASINLRPTTAGSDLAQGEGVLVWRISGIPAYDRRNVFARYSGNLRDGYPDGHGEMRYRSGRYYKGDWVSGRPHGVGQESMADGTHYFGAFANGNRAGDGRLVQADHTILDGTFKNGQAHGVFNVTLPGGTQYSAVWEDGVEIDRDLDAVYLDSTLAGLLKAQSGDAASRAVLSMVLDTYTTAQSELRYTAMPGAGRTLVFTERADLVDAWNGTAPLKTGAGSWLVFEQPWDMVYAYLNANMQTIDGSTVPLDRLWLEVASSVAYLKPMLQLSLNYGETGFKASYELYNLGWGAVEAAELTFQIVDPTGRTSGSQLFKIPIAPFDRQGSFNVESILSQFGIDVQALKNARFPCSSRTMTNQCLNNALSVLNLGTAAPFIGVLESSLVFSINGTLTYAWRDASGQQQTASQPLQTYIHVATMDFGDLAESGSGWADVPEAPGHVEIILPVGQQNYSFDLPFRAGSNVAQFVYPLKLRSMMSSTHDFRIGAQFRDGSIRYSAPATLFYFRPRGF